MDKTCNMCKNNQIDEKYVSMVHKWREYHGYSQLLYPRYFCSKECLEFFEKEFRCNHCHIVVYDGVDYKTGKDGMTYCYDEVQITIGDRPCYDIVHNNI